MKKFGLLLVGVLLVGCTNSVDSEVDPNEVKELPPTEQQVDNNVYSNEQLGFEIDVPTAWQEHGYEVLEAEYAFECSLGEDVQVNDYVQFVVDMPSWPEYNALSVGRLPKAEWNESLGKYVEDVSLCNGDDNVFPLYVTPIVDNGDYVYFHTDPVFQDAPMECIGSDQGSAPEDCYVDFATDLRVDNEPEITEKEVINVPVSELKITDYPDYVSVHDPSETGEAAYEYDVEDRLAVIKTFLPEDVYKDVELMLTGGPRQSVKLVASKSNFNGYLLSACMPHACSNQVVVIDFDRYYNPPHTPRQMPQVFVLTKFRDEDNVRIYNEPPVELQNMLVNEFLEWGN